MAKKWVQGAVKHPGALHEEMGVPAGQKIPAGELAAKEAALHEKAKRGKLTDAQKTTLRRVIFARVAKGFSHHRKRA